MKTFTSFKPVRQASAATALLGKAATAAGAVLFATAAATQASTDYGPAIWRPPCNANYNTTGNGHKFHVIHDIEGYYWNTISMFNACGYTSASIHYLVNGKTDTASDAAPGEITQSVRDAYYAWHARCWNLHATGTEHEGFASNPAWYTDALYSASAGITRNLSAKFGWAKDRNHVVAHGQKSVPGWSTWAAANLGIDPNCNTHTDPGPYWDWAKYMNMVNSSAGAMRLDLFVRDANNACVHRFHAGSGWSGWENIGGSLASDPAACSWGTDRIDVFARGNDNAIWHKFWNVNAWSAWESLGESIVGAPEVCSWGANRLDIFWRGTDNALKHKCWNGSNWTAAESLGGVLTSDPSAVAWGPNRIDIFCRSTDNAMWHIYWGGTAWSGWENVGGNLVGAPDASSWAAGRLDVFARGADNQMYHNLWEGTTWSGWAPMGGNLASDPAATSYAYNRLDAFALGTDNAVWTRWWNGSAWSAWGSLGGNCIGSPAVCSWTHPQ